MGGNTAVPGMVGLYTALRSLVAMSLSQSTSAFLNMSSAAGRVRPPLPVLPVMTSRYQRSEPAEYSSVSCPSSSSSSGQWSTSPSPSTISYACHSASSSQSSFDGMLRASLRPKIPRPLPQIPNGPSISASPGASTFPRPLPIPPSPPLLQEPGLSNQYLVRPLPLPRSPDNSNISLPSCPTSCTSLRLTIPSSSPAAVLEKLASPYSPISPIVFSSAATMEVTTPEEPVGKRLSVMSAMVFAEMHPASPDNVAPPQRFQETDVVDSELETRAITPLQFSDREDVEVTVELVPLSPTAKRTSRFWMVEKKGRRWVENDYQEIIQELRML